MRRVPLTVCRSVVVGLSVTLREATGCFAEGEAAWSSVDVDGQQAVQ